MNTKELRSFLENPNAFDVNLIQSNNVLGTIFNVLSKSPKNQNNKQLCYGINIDYLSILKILFEQLEHPYFQFILKKICSNTRLKLFNIPEIYLYLKQWNNIHNNKDIDLLLFFSALNQNLEDEYNFYCDKVLLSFEEHVFAHQLISYLKFHKGSSIYVKNIIERLPFKTQVTYYLSFYILKEQPDFITYINEKINNNKFVFLQFIAHSNFLKNEISEELLFHFIEFIKYDLDYKTINNIMNHKLMYKNLNLTITFYNLIKSTENFNSVELFLNILSKKNNVAFKEWFVANDNLQNF